MFGVIIQNLCEITVMAENAFRQSLLGSGGSMLVFVSNPLVASITALALIMLFWPLISAALARLKRSAA